MVVKLDSRLQEALDLIAKGETKIVFFDEVFDTNPQNRIGSIDEPVIWELKSVSVAYDCSGDSRSEDEIIEWLIEKVKDKEWLHYADDTKINILLVREGEVVNG